MTISKGDRVAILNRNMEGTFIIEGYATVLRYNEGMPSKVRFDNDRHSVERFVDEAAQADPVAYVAQMNAPVKTA